MDHLRGEPVVSGADSTASEAPPSSDHALGLWRPGSSWLCSRVSSGRARACGMIASWFVKVDIAFGSAWPAGGDDDTALRH